MGLRRNTSKLLGPLRSVLVIHLLTVICLGTLAGMFLSGNATAFSALHEIGSRFLVGICLIQIVLTALLRMRVDRRDGRLLFPIGILVAELLETYAGYRRVPHLACAFGNSDLRRHYAPAVLGRRDSTRFQGGRAAES